MGATLLRRPTDRERQDSRLLLGAAVGTGMAARSAERGGADFLLALNAGKLRSMGAPSIASLLPLRDSNAQVMEFATAEILGSVKLPVFFGASAFDPRQSLEALLDRIGAEGFAGVVNFPTSIFFSGTFRQRIEAAGVGFARELELLRLARGRGLLALGYVHTLAEARQMASAGADIINLNLGWNNGGSSGAYSPIALDEAAEFARLVVRSVRQLSPSCVCVIEGGPIVHPADMYYVTQQAQADGYIGGSTIDRIPLELSIEQVTAAFKAVGVLRSRVQELERQVSRVRRDFGIIGNSDSIRKVQHDIGRMAGGRLPVIISGPPGSGKEQVARALHQAGGRHPNAFIVLGADDCTEQRMFGVVHSTERSGKRTLLGRFEVNPGVTIYLEEVGRLALPMQGRILDMIENESFQRIGDNAARTFEGRILFGTSVDPTELIDRRKFDVRLAFLLRGGHIALPALKDRLDDLLVLAQYFLKDARILGRINAASLESAALGALLRYGWPGNVRELRSVIERAAIAAGDAAVIKPEHLPKLSEAQQNMTPLDERGWILDGLRRNRFRKIETARFLGLSRKTLYNKMRQFQLPIASRNDNS